MREPKLKRAAYEQIARVGKALAAPARLDLLDLLAQGPRTVEALAREADQSVANASQHLQVLRAARLVEAEKEGLFVTYRLAGDGVPELVRALRVVAERRITELDALTRAFLHGRGELEPVDEEELLDRVRRNEVTVIDVRPAEEWAAGHLAGAISMPLADLRRRMKELPKRKTIVAYCRGPYCVFALDAVKILRAAGHRAERLSEGVPDFRARGLRVESAPPPARSAAARRA